MGEGYEKSFRIQQLLPTLDIVKNVYKLIGNDTCHRCKRETENIFADTDRKPGNDVTTKYTQRLLAPEGSRQTSIMSMSSPIQKKPAIDLEINPQCTRRELTHIGITVEKWQSLERKKPRMPEI